MLIATVTAIMILMGGGTALVLPFFKDAVKSEVADKERRKEAVAYIDEASSATKDFRKRFKEHSKQLIAINHNPDATRQEYDAFTASEDAHRHLLQQAILDARFGVVDTLTEEEWNAVYEAALAKAREKDAEAAEKAEKKNK